MTVPKRSWDLRRRINEMRIRRRRIAQIRRDSRPQVVVYTFGKSGTTAITETLDRAGYAALHVHALTRDRLGEYKAVHRAHGMFPMPHVTTAEFLLEHPPTPGRRWRVITSIRDPIARDIAAHFQNAWWMRVDQHPPVEDLIRPRTVRWFDEDVRPALGIDVYEKPFDHAEGCETYQGPGVDLLVVRQESLRPEPLAAFLGCPVPEIVRANVGADKPYRESYRTYLESVTVPAAILDEVYASRFATHFYSPEELEGFRRRWSSG